jgi:hypothetical protein
MRLRLEASSPEELRAKAPDLLARLAKAVEEAAPNLAESLERVASEAEAEAEELTSDHALLRHLSEVASTRYTAMLGLMLAELSAALDEHVADKLPG